MVSTLYNVNYFNQPFPTVEEFLFLGGKLNLADYSGINCVIVSKTDTIARDEFCPSLAYYNTTRFSRLTVI